jgi:hypothetical protein
LVQIGWDEAPHISDAAKAELLAATPPYLRDARSKGVPSLGSGAVYPVGESEIVVEPFEIPKYWPKGYGMDVGWNRTAACWFAHDRESDVLYLYSEHYQGQAEPSVHAEAIKARGQWLRGVIDPASKGRGQADGTQLLERYQSLGLNLSVADNGVEAGIFEVWQRLSSGRLKVFRSCVNFLTEYRMYRRDEKGKVVKANDHAMDASRYFCMSGIPLMSLQENWLKLVTGKPKVLPECDPFAEEFSQMGAP